MDWLNNRTPLFFSTVCQFCNSSSAISRIIVGKRQLCETVWRVLPSWNQRTKKYRAKIWDPRRKERSRFPSPRWFGVSLYPPISVQTVDADRYTYSEMLSSICNSGTVSFKCIWEFKYIQFIGKESNYGFQIRVLLLCLLLLGSSQTWGRSWKTIWSHLQRWWYTDFHYCLKMCDFSPFEWINI